MVYDNTVDFSAFPARDACKVLGGRIPNSGELTSIYANRATYGTFVNDLYWTNVDNSVTNVVLVDFSTGSLTTTNMNNYEYTRCVLD